MAEAASTGSNLLGKIKDDLECAVCLQSCIHPAQLPCGHIFCFLCVKGIANQSKKCAMCRQDIPRDFIEQPTLLQSNMKPEQTKTFDEGYQWFYEGRNGWWQYDERANEEIEQVFKLNQTIHEILICGQLYVIDFENNFQFPKKHPSRKRFIKREKTENVHVKGVAGWWQYDERTSKELEVAYKAGDKTCELLIAGFLYIVDLENMLQIRRNDPSRRRSIKRDFASIPKKGIAGLRTDVENLSEYQSATLYESRSENTIPITPSNTPQSPTSESQSPEQHDLLERFQALHLDTTLLRTRRHTTNSDEDSSPPCTREDLNEL